MCMQPATAVAVRDLLPCCPDHHTAGAARPKRADQMNDEELKQALPSMLFTTSNLIWSSKWGAAAAWQRATAAAPAAAAV